MSADKPSTPKQPLAARVIFCMFGAITFISIPLGVAGMFITGDLVKQAFISAGVFLWIAMCALTLDFFFSITRRK